MERVIEIEAEIEALREELSAVEGTETEVYSRIVGYYRSVRNWNLGKREEYEIRRVFETPAPGHLPETATLDTARHTTTPTKASLSGDFTPSSYICFTRSTCPNCPPVKQFLHELSLPGKLVDVDEDMALAQRYGVMAAPTVIFLDDEELELYRSYTVQEMEKQLQHTEARLVQV